MNSVVSNNQRIVSHFCGAIEMKAHVTLTIWTGVAYGAVKRVAVPYEFGITMADAMREYAEEHGFILALMGENGTAGLYWNRDGQLLRLAIEEINT